MQFELIKQIKIYKKVFIDFWFKQFGLNLVYYGFDMSFVGTIVGPMYTKIF